jgi:putative acetyltransferase
MNPTVLPRAQRLGVGSELIRAGPARGAVLGYDVVTVLGELVYYRRFGFETASRFGLAPDYGVDEPFMALPLHADGSAASRASSHISPSSVSWRRRARQQAEGHKGGDTRGRHGRGHRS